MAATPMDGGVNLIVRGGRVLDPASGRDEVADIAIAGSTIRAIGAGLEAWGAAVVNAAGCWVVPGLIDSHAHCYDGVGEMGIDPDEIGVHSGVTTVIDAGSSGWATFEGFRRYVVARAQTRVLALLHFSSIGLAMGSGGCELSDPVMFDPRRLVETIQAHAEVVVGIKVRACRAAVRDLGLQPLRIASDVAHQLGVPLHVHIGETDPVPGQSPPPPIGDVVDLLEAGDVVTHVFTSHPGGVLDEHGILEPSVRAAYERGVRFDTAHGLKNLSFERVHRVVDQGLEPWTISTDAHRLNRRGPVFDLPTTMAKFLALGFSFERIVAQTTWNPARTYHRANEIGSIDSGRTADLSILRVIDQPWQAVDSTGAVLHADRGIEPVYAIRAGKLVECQPNARPYSRPSSAGVHG